MGEKFSENSEKRTMIKRGFMIVRCFSIFIGCVALLLGVTMTHEGMNTLGDSASKALDLSTNRLLPSTPNVTYELEARYAYANDDMSSPGEGDVWQRGVIFVGQGDMIEVRLKVSALQADDASLEAVYYNGLSMAPFNGLKWIEPDNWHSVTLPDGRVSDYAENAFEPTAQYYHIGTLRLNWGEWLYDDNATPMVKVWKNDGPEAIMYAVPPYNLEILRKGVAYLSIAGIFVLILPSILGIIEIITMKRLLKAEED